MKKLIFTVLFLVAFTIVKSAHAQGRSIHGASDYKVTLPVVPPQVNAGLGVSTPALTTPSIPSVQTFSSPFNTPGPSIPAPPPAPPVGSLPPTSTFSTTLNLPVVPTLPPIPPIPAMPDVRLPIGSH